MSSLATRLFKLFATSSASAGRPQARPLATEELEARELMAADWFSTYIPNTAVANLVRTDWNSHGAVTRTDMLAVYGQVERDGVVDASEYNSLKFLATYGNLLKMTPAVQSLAGEVVSTSDPASARYQGAAIGYLGANSPAWKLQDEVAKWFLGADHPTLAAGTSGTYQSSAGTLFGAGGPKYTDINQGYLGDCTYLSSLAETAARTSLVGGMFTANGDNTWTVRLFHNGAPVYVTVDNQLPNGGWLYDQPQGGVLWASLAEKAVAQVNEEGWLGSVQPGVNSYNAINNGNAGTVVAALSLFSGQSATAVAVASNATDVAQAMAAGKLVVLATGNTTADSHVVHNHAYAVVGYNPSSSLPFTVYNPWGHNVPSNGSVWTQFIANGAFLKANFSYEGHTNAAPGGTNIGGTVAGVVTGGHARLADEPAASDHQAIDAAFSNRDIVALTRQPGAAGFADAADRLVVAHDQSAALASDSLDQLFAGAATAFRAV